MAAIYRLRENIVVRDIGGIFFLIDIADKHCYSLKKLYSVNAVGKAIVEFMAGNPGADTEAIAEHLARLIKGYKPAMKEKIQNDVAVFLAELSAKGFMGGAQA